MRGLQEGRKAFDELHTQAGVFRKHNPATGFHQVKRKVAEGIFDEAYLWPMFE